MDRTQAIADLLALIASIKRTMHGRTYACADGSRITSSQLSVLLTLRHHGTQTTHRLAKRLALTPGAVSQIVEVLSGKGFVTRTARIADRRVYDLSLSDSGSRQADAIERTRRGFVANIVKDLSDQELELLIATHRKILQAMQNEIKPTDTKG